MKKNLLLCIDLQTFLLSDNLLRPEKQYLGLLRCKLPSEGNFYGDQYEFKEVKIPLKSCRRNVHLFIGQYITLTCRPDGSLRLNLRNIDLSNIDIDSFCLELMNEIRQVLKGFVEN
jgi:hypothetical protein